MTVRLKWVDGFELSNIVQTLVQARYNTAAAVTVTLGRQGWGRALKYVGPGTLTLKLAPAFTTTPNTALIGFGFKFTDAASSELIAVRRSGFTQASIWLVRDSASFAQFELRRGSSTLLATSGTFTIPAGQWMYIEWRVSVSNTGSTELRVDQIPVFDGSNIDLQEIGTSGIDDLWINVTTNSVNSEFNFDDLYVADGLPDVEFLGAITTQAVQPIADATTAYQGPSGAQPTYPYVSESTPDDSNFITPLVSPGTGTQRYIVPPVNPDLVCGDIFGVMLGIHHDDSAGVNESVEPMFYDPAFALSVYSPIKTYNGFAFIETVGVFTTISVTDHIETQELAALQMGFRGTT